MAKVVERNAAAEMVGKMTIQVIATPLAIVLGLMSGLPVTLYAAFLAHRMWTWFVQPLTSQPTPSLLIMAGLLTLVRVATYRLDTHEDSDEQKQRRRGVLTLTGLSLLILSFFWLIGWVIHLLDTSFTS